MLYDIIILITTVKILLCLAGWWEQVGQYRSSANLFLIIPLMVLNNTLLLASAVTLLFDIGQIIFALIQWGLR